MCNGKEALYIPVNHINATLRVRLSNQIDEDVIRNVLRQVKEKRNFKWVYHNSRFDLAVFRTFLGFDMPAPYWDTLIAANIIEQDLNSILEAISFTDYVIFGRLHYNKTVSEFASHKEYYNSCAHQVISFCQMRGIRYHIKKGTLVE